MFWELGREYDGRLNPLDSPGQRDVSVVVHPVCAESKMARGPLDAGAKSLFGIPEA
jgi:hypothetical protein